MKKEAIFELIDELSQLDEDEKSVMKSSIDEFVKESPKTELAISRFNRIKNKIPIDSKEDLKALLIGIVSNAIYGRLFG